MINAASPPDGLIVTISQQMLQQKGYRNWLRNFLSAMARDDCTYWMKQGAKPKHQVLYVYLCIGGKVRFRANFVMTEGPCEKKFGDGEVMFARAWIVLAGPLERPPYPIKMNGF